MITVTLLPWEIEWANHVGSQRELHARTANNAIHYDPERMEDNIRADIAGASGEIAVAKYYNVYWSGSFWAPSDKDAEYRSMPDMYPNFEVRRIRERHHSLVVRKRDVEAARNMFLVWPHGEYFQEVDLLGWIDAREGWEIGKAPYWDQTGTIHLVSQKDLKHPKDFAFVETY